MALIVIYDANVLYPNKLRDLLIRIAQQPHLVQAKWSTRRLCGPVCSRSSIRAQGAR
jgi:hypothetical protein